jgi:hypothetical protein
MITSLPLESFRFSGILYELCPEVLKRPVVILYYPHSIRKTMTSQRNACEMRESRNPTETQRAGFLNAYFCPFAWAGVPPRCRNPRNPKGVSRPTTASAMLSRLDLKGKKLKIIHPFYQVIKAAKCTSLQPPAIKFFECIQKTQRSSAAIKQPHTCIMGFHPMIKHWAQLRLGRLTNQEQSILQVVNKWFIKKFFLK